MSALSNNPNDYYFYTKNNNSSRACLVVLSEQGYWDSQGFKNGTLSGGGESINLDLVQKIIESTGFEVAELIEGIIEIWSNQEKVNTEYLKKSLEACGMIFNPIMEKAWKNFDVDMLLEE